MIIAVNCILQILNPTFSNNTIKFTIQRKQDPSCFQLIGNQEINLTFYNNLIFQIPLNNLNIDLPVEVQSQCQYQFAHDCAEFVFYISKRSVAIEFSLAGNTVETLIKQSQVQYISIQDIGVINYNMKSQFIGSCQIKKINGISNISINQEGISETLLQQVLEKKIILSLCEIDGTMTPILIQTNLNQTGMKIGVFVCVVVALIILVILIIFVIVLLVKEAKWRNQVKIGQSQQEFQSNGNHHVKLDQLY